MKYRSIFALAALSVGAAVAQGCVADRPSRNGVFNENQYIRKEFLVRPGDGTKPDNGWFMKASVLATSTPNPLAAANFDAFITGATSDTKMVRFVVTQDKLQIVNLRELSQYTDLQNQAETRQPEVVNAWPVTNVDLKYRINLDGEKSNFYEENQELDWQVRQWVKVNFAKNDYSDVAPLGPGAASVLDKCSNGDASTTYVTDSLVVDEPNDYMQFKVQVSVPLKFDDADCNTLFGDQGVLAQRLGRSNVTFTVMYSFSRVPDKSTYTPMVVAEKDPIRRKYGPITYTAWSRDTESGMLAANEYVYRYDPDKPLVYYFAPGVPDEFKKMFTDPGGIVEQTNDVFAKANAQVRLSVKNFDEDLKDGERPREYGDVRYNWIRYIDDLDVGAGGVLGVTMPTFDPRSGEALGTTINVFNFPWQDYVAQRVDAYLQAAGVSEGLNSSQPWSPTPTDVDGTQLPATCNAGDTIPLITDKTDSIQKNIYVKSSLFSKIQTYMGKPSASYGPLGPKDFIQDHSGDANDFFSAYYALTPYLVYGDPASNQFVTWEGGAGTSASNSGTSAWALAAKERHFQELSAKVDRGETPFDTSMDNVPGSSSINQALAFLNDMRQSSVDHHTYEYANQIRSLSNHAFKDTATIFSFPGLMNRAARHCVNGHWETKEEWIASVVNTYFQQIVWHEFGHALGLEHNFMGSVDRPNFPYYTDSKGKTQVGQYTSSVMEYNVTADRIFAKSDYANGSIKAGDVFGWAPYDRGAIGFIYANADANSAPKPVDAKQTAQGISGQVSPTAPWNDPLGFDQSGKERQFLYCDERHMKYTPLCRQHDFGSTPSEIIAADLENYEWQYTWRNFRAYRKVWDESNYATVASDFINDMRRFLPLLEFDWSPTEIADKLRRIGVKLPPNAPSAQDYYNQLANKFIGEVSRANQLSAAFHKAVIQQASGERPYRTIYDNFYGDVTQQGIILDKLYAMQNWVGLWEADNYDPTQASGVYLASWTVKVTPDTTFQAIAEDAVTSMVGETNYDAFPYFKPTAVALFAQDTHRPEFFGRVEARDWIGGKVFTRRQDYLDFFRTQAEQNGGKFGCTRFDAPTCTWDPTIKRQYATDVNQSDLYHEFVGADGRRWAWAYIDDRNTWVFVDRDRNTASYKIINNYVTDVFANEDDGNISNANGANGSNAYDNLLPVKYFLDSFNQFN